MAAGALVDETLSAALPHVRPSRHHQPGVGLHVIEGAMGNYFRKHRLAYRDFQEGRKAPDRAFEIGLQLVVVKELHVCQGAHSPPGPYVFPIGKGWKSVAFKPAEKEVTRLASGPFDRRADAARRGVENPEIVVAGVGKMIEQAPRHIAAIARDIHIFGLGREYQRINGQVCFEKSAMALGFRYPGPERAHGAGLYPERQVADRQSFRALGQELGNNLLDPGCPRFRIGGNDNVVVAEPDQVPGG